MARTRLGSSTATHQRRMAGSVNHVLFYSHIVRRLIKIGRCNKALDELLHLRYLQAERDTHSSSIPVPRLRYGGKDPKVMASRSRRGRRIGAVVDKLKKLYVDRCVREP